MNRNEMLKAMYIARKDIRIYYLKAPVIVMGLVIPAFLYLAFSLGRGLEPPQAVSSIVALAVFFLSSTMSVVVLPIERSNATFERLVAAPVLPFTLVIGKILPGVAFGTSSSILMLLASSLIRLKIEHSLLTILTILLSSLTFSTLGILFSVKARVISEAMVPFNLVRFPMLFLSGVFLPVKQLPGLLRPLSHLLPLTYATNLLRHGVVGGEISPHPLIQFLILALFFAAFLILTIRLLRSSLS